MRVVQGEGEPHSPRLVKALQSPQPLPGLWEQCHDLLHDESLWGPATSETHSLMSGMGLPVSPLCPLFYLFCMSGTELGPGCGVNTTGIESCVRV